MNKKILYSLIAVLALSAVVVAVLIFCRPPAPDIAAEYTRNSLAWSNAEVFGDGSIALDFANGETTVQIKNSVKGRIVCNLYIYEDKASSAEAQITAKGLTELGESEYPAFLENIKCAYRVYLKGKRKTDFKITARGNAALKLLIVIEDNNSYPKKQQTAPTLANVKVNAEVLLDGQYPRGKDYSFTLKDAAGAVIETVHNDDGYISFSNLAIKEKGSFVYYLSQNAGKDSATQYDKAVYKITVVVEGKNAAAVFYEKDGVPKESLPRFSNYKEIKDINSAGKGVQYPTNAKKADNPPNYLLWSVLAIAVLLLLLYILAHRKKR